MRQLKRLGVDQDRPPSGEQWESVLETASRTYAEFEQDRYTLERSLAISSREMRELYDELKRSSDSQIAIERDKLSRNVAIYEAVLEVSLDAVLVIDQDRRVIGYNRRFSELWDLPVDVLSTHDDDLMLGAVLAKLTSAEEFLARVRYLYEHPMESSHEEIELVDGRCFDRHSAPVVLETGEPCGRVWFFRDVTARKRDERQIRETNWFLDSIVENIPNMVFVKDAATLRFIRVNRGLEELTGWRRDDLCGKSDADFFPPEQAAQFTADDRTVLAQRGLITTDEEIQTRHRGTRSLITKKIPMCDQNGTPIYLLGISEDVTVQREQSVELLAAKAAAEKANRVKSDFLLDMSHELRTPLNAILGFGRVLDRALETKLDGDQRTYLQNIVLAGELMEQLVSDLLDLRSLEE